MNGTAHLREIINISSYFFLPGEHEFTGQFMNVFTQTAQIFNTDSLYNGKVIITNVDTVTGIITGTFYFDAIDTTTNEVVHITEGRFDVK